MSNIVGKILSELIRIIVLIWTIAALIPLWIGVVMIDIVMRLFGIDKTMLLWTDVSVWCEKTGNYLRTKYPKEN